MITIRRGREHDLPGLSFLFDMYRIFYKRESDLPSAEHFLRERMEKNESVIFVAANNEQMVGFTQLFPLFSSTRMKRLWLLNDLFVLQEFRGQGLSKQLLEAAKDLARDTNAAGLLLETEKANAIGNHLYPAAGFDKYEENNFYWWHNH
jgi:GNAT superfamily N-acetyltransferase